MGEEESFDLLTINRGFFCLFGTLTRLSLDPISHSRYEHADCVIFIFYLCAKLRCGQSTRGAIFSRRRRPPCSEAGTELKPT